MTDLETRVAALEKGAAFNANQDAIRKREEEFLATLREMKASMLKEQKTNAATGGASSEELKNLQEENAKLKAQLAKQAYRIEHLVAGMERMISEKK